MTTVDILFRYAEPPTDAVTTALAATREVYGMRQLRFDRNARTLTVEYDATRLNAATVESLVLRAGLRLVADEDASAAELSVPAPAPAA